MSESLNDPRHQIELTTGRDDLEIGRVYRFHEISGEDIIAGGEILTKRPGEKGTTVYTVDLSCLKYNVANGKGRAFEVMS